MSDIDKDKIEADGQEATEQAEAPAKEGTKSRSKKSSKKGSSKTEAPAVDWNPETSGLSFLNDANADADDDSLARFEELAKRIAATVSKNKTGHELPDEETQSAEAAENAIEAAEAAGEQTEEITDETLVAEASEPEVTAEIIEETEVTEMTEPGESTETVEATGSMDSLFAAAGEIEEKPAKAELAEVSTEFVEADRMISIVESLLFSTDKPVSVATIQQAFKGTNIRSKDVKRALEQLASEYAASTRGVTLEELNGGYQLRTKSDNSEFLRRLAKVRPFRLSGASLEVMAIVAYKQPVTKHEIDEIRGVESGHLLRALMERGLVSFGEKSDLPGKPMTYLSTRKFLEIFGLRNLRELPTLGEIDELLPEGIGEIEEKETLSDVTEQMATEIVSKYSEGEEELLQIQEQLKAVDTTTEFFEQEKVRERDRRDRERAQDIRERLVVGETVESKDRKWLDRYDAKLLEPASVEGAASAATAEQAQAAGEPGAEGEQVVVSEELTIAVVEVSAEGEDDFENENDISEELEDLTARQDWTDENGEEV